MVIFISEIVFEKERKSLQTGPRGLFSALRGLLGPYRGPNGLQGGSRIAFRGGREGSEAEKK